MSKIESENWQTSDKSYSRRQRATGASWVAMESPNLLYFETVSSAFPKIGMGLWCDIEIEADFLKNSLELIPTQMNENNYKCVLIYILLNNEMFYA